MAMTSTLPNNIGAMDRVTRTGLGGWLLMSALSNLSPSLIRRWQLFTGLGLLISAVMGFCPLMKLLRASTVPGRENNILHQLKQMAPGQGINPIQTQQAYPQHEIKFINPDKPLAEALTIS